jgi:hypothetical protein
MTTMSGRTMSRIHVTLHTLPLPDVAVIDAVGAVDNGRLQVRYLLDAVLVPKRG